MAILCCGVYCIASRSSAQDVLTHHYDFYRSGVQSHETQLTPANVRTATFGKVFSLPVVGQVYAEPLWVGAYTMADGKPHNVLFVATGHDNVYAFDAGGTNPAAGYYWHVNLLGKGETAVPATETQTDDITPEVGIVGTPVIDRAAGVLYVVAKSKLVSGGTTTYFQRLHALSLATGKEAMNGPVVIHPILNGTGDGSTGSTIAFDSLSQNQRAALALSHGSVWIAWASHGDNYPYHGYVMGYDASDLTKSTGIFVDTPNGSDGGIWMSGGGISVDQSGNLYVASGNGTFDANTKGQDYADSALKLTPVASALDLASSFTPYDQDTLSSQDLDFGTSACTLIDNPGGPYPHLLVTTDKSGQIYLLDRDKMGGYHQNTNQDLQDFSDGGFDVHSSFAFFGNRLYLAGDGGPLSAWTFNPATGHFNTSPTTAPDSTFGCDGCDGAGATPSISANGTANAIVWVLDNSNYLNGPAVLHAFGPTLATELYASNMAAGNRDQADTAIKFTTPTIANGFVYVGGAGSVTVYGLIKNAPPTTATPVLSPNGKDLTGPVTVTISDKTPGAVIHYTLNETTPTALSPVYSTPLVIRSTTELRAAAIAPGIGLSGVAKADYVIGTPGNVFTLDSGLTAGSFYLNGSAKIAQKRLRLTDGGPGEAGSAWYRTPVPISNFTTHFDLQLSDAEGDGMTFVIQAEGPAALGPAGGGLGYGPDTPGVTPGISPSAAVKFDLYDNAGEGVDSTGFYTNGASPTVPSVNLSKTPIDLHSGHIFAVTLTYNGARLVETIEDTATHKSATAAYSVDLPKILGRNAAFVGFTGGTGGATVVADVLNWSWSAPTPETFAVTALTAAVSQSAPKLKPWSDPKFPNGAGVLFPATAASQSVTFTVDVASAATYAIDLLTDTAGNRGTLQLSVDGKSVGSPVDTYGFVPGAITGNFGSVLLAAGKHAFTFTVTGKNKSSAGYAATFGRITLTP